MTRGRVFDEDKTKLKGDLIMDKITTAGFLKELNRVYLDELYETSTVANSLVEQEVTVLQSFEMLKKILKDSELSKDIRYAISSAMVEVTENFVGQQLDEMKILGLEDWFTNQYYEADASVHYDKDKGEYFVTGRIKTYSRLYPGFSESELKDPELLDYELSLLTALAANDLLDRANQKVNL